MGIKITPEKIARFMGMIALALVILSTAGYVARFFLGYNSKLISGFSLGYEGNFPTYFQSISLLFCACLLMVVALSHMKERRKHAFHWTLLSAIFVFLSVDEMLDLHEALILPVRRLLNTRGALRFAWVIPYGILVIILFLASIRFLIDLPRRIRELFMAGGSTYVLGALGMEMIGSKYYDLHGGNNFTYVMLQSFEESLEMLGIIIFVYAVSLYIRDHIGKITLEIE